MKDTGFRWHRKGGFWYAKDRPAQRELAEELAGQKAQPTEQTAKTTKPKAVKLTKANGDKLRALADKMAEQIDAKFNSGVSQQNPTARRAAIAESMRRDGEAMQKVQAVLYGLADDIDGGTLPEYLAGVKSKALITDLLQSEARRNYYPESWSYSDSDGRRKKAGITASNYAEVTDKLASYIKPPTAEEIRTKELAKLEQNLIGVKIEGFFPTPSAVIELMLNRAAIELGDTVLEPSAGKGDIADKVREQYPQNTLHTIEVNGRLRDVLTAKGHEIVERDFLDLESAEYDVIVMNPPFERMADIEHLRKAFDHLKEGGRVVSLMSESPFFRTDRKAEEFREWLDEVGGYAEKLDEGSFKGADSFRQTGVNARMVVIEK